MPANGKFSLWARRTGDAVGMHFNLNMRTKFRKLKQQYCMHKKLREEDCRFSFRAVPIEGEHTPAVLGMVPVRRGEAGEWWWEVSEPVLVEVDE